MFQRRPQLPQDSEEPRHATIQPRAGLSKAQMQASRLGRLPLTLASGYCSRRLQKKHMSLERDVQKHWTCRVYGTLLTTRDLQLPICTSNNLCRPLKSIKMKWFKGFDKLTGQVDTFGCLPQTLK